MAPPNSTSTPEAVETFAGASRFELELEFVSSLANPFYMQHLASQKFFDDPAFLAYIDYLAYWSSPDYSKYLPYPGPTLMALQLLRQDRFRRDILAPETVNTLALRWAQDASS